MQTENINRNNETKRENLTATLQNVLRSFAIYMILCIVLLWDFIILHKLQRNLTLTPSEIKFCLIIWGCSFYFLYWLNFAQNEPARGKSHLLHFPVDKNSEIFFLMNNSKLLIVRRCIGHQGQPLAAVLKTEKYVFYC